MRRLTMPTSTCWERIRIPIPGWRAGVAALDLGEQVVGGADLGGDFDARLAQERGEAVANDQVVVGDHDAHGSSALTVVPPPGGLETCSSPSSASSRSSRPRRPEPREASAPPMPLSATSIVMLVPLRATRSVTAVACEYFATLASASEATK